jgi:hypothetical protein
MAPSMSIAAVQTISISISLIASGGIAALSVFDVPELQAQPASRSLPSIRWLFSRGSHIFPQAAFLSGAGFSYLAYKSLPAASATITQLVKIAANGSRVNGFLAAGLLCISIGPVTTFAMIPTNFALIKMNADKGGARSSASAAAAQSNGQNYKAGERSATDSVNGKGEGREFTDLSGPQSRTVDNTSGAEDEKVRELLTKFSRLNMLRAVLLGAGGILGLVTALAF